MIHLLEPFVLKQWKIFLFSYVLFQIYKIFISDISITIVCHIFAYTYEHKQNNKLQKKYDIYLPLNVKRWLNATCYLILHKTLSVAFYFALCILVIVWTYIIYMTCFHLSANIHGAKDLPKNSRFSMFMLHFCLLFSFFCFLAFFLNHLFHFYLILPVD